MVIAISYSHQIQVVIFFVFDIGMVVGGLEKVIWNQRKMSIFNEEL